MDRARKLLSEAAEFMRNFSNDPGLNKQQVSELNKKADELSHERISPWQPIETAPKDCDILVWTDDAGVDIARWDSYSELWYRARCVDGLPFRRGSVTHWMPLPEPPVK